MNIVTIIASHILVAAQFRLSELTPKLQ